MQSISDLHQIFLNSRGVVTDSRKDTRDKIFFALRGPNFNGNKYAPMALDSGAKLAVVDDLKYADDHRYMVVSDSLSALQNLAIFHRKYLGVPVLAITGSNGKTTTKELIKAVLSTTFKIHATAGNFNNLIGLPLTILDARSGVDIMILEMGSNAPGEIQQLCDIALPDIGIITNIGKAHLEGFGDLSGVRQEKTALYRSLKSRKGLALVRMDDAILLEAARELDHVLYYFESTILKNHDTGIGISIDSTVPKIQGRFIHEDIIYSFQSELVGEHNALNIMAAIAIGIHLKVEPEKICQGIDSYVPENNRTQLIRSENKIVLLDAYNANPVSMREALKTLANWPNPKKAVILGDMLELGGEESLEHHRVLEMIEELEIKEVYLVGNVFSRAASKFKTYTNVQNLIAMEPDLNKILEDHIVLIKGSRGIRLEQVLDHITGIDSEDE